MGNNHPPKVARLYELRNHERTACKQSKWPPVPHVKQHRAALDFEEKVTANRACWSARNKLWAWTRLMNGQSIDNTIRDLDVQFDDDGVHLPGDMVYGRSWAHKYWDLCDELIAMKSDPRLK